MNKGIVLFIAEKGVHEVFYALSLKGEEIEMRPFGDASNYLADYNIDLILLDCDFNIQKGLDFLRLAKTSRPDVPVFFLADGNFRNMAMEIIGAGARKFFCKPVRVIDLQNTIETMLKIKRASKESRMPLFLETDAGSSLLNETATTDKPLNLLNSIRYMEENLTEKLNLDLISGEANLSKYHFCRFFFRHTGMTPLNFLNFLRIERAKELIKKKNLTISAIARNAGFSNTNTFSKQFKKLTGLTPIAYKSSLHSGRFS